MKEQLKISLHANFQVYTLKEGFVWEEDALPSSHAPVVFHTNPCNFASFQAAIKSLPFGLIA